MLPWKEATVLVIWPLTLLPLVTAESLMVCSWLVGSVTTCFELDAPPQAQWVSRLLVVTLRHGTCLACCSRQTHQVT